MHAPLVAVAESDMAPSNSGLIQMIEQVDEKHESGHKRLRESLMELQEQHENLLASVSSLRDFAKENANKIGRIAETPPNVENVIMTPRVLIGIVIFAVSIAGGIWSSTSGLRSDVRDILTRMDAQKAADTSAREMQNLQWSQLRSDVDEVKKQQKMQQIEVQDLKEMMLGGRGRNTR